MSATGKIITGIILTIVFTVGLAWLLFPDVEKDIAEVTTPKQEMIVETPRNDEPMENYTPYFGKYQFPVGNRTYTYYWYQPEKPWPKNLKFPLVLVLHGTPGRSYAARFLISRPTVTEYPAFVLVPVLATGRTWALPSNDQTLNRQYALGDMVDIIKTLETLYPIDTSRLYVVGCSEGGTGVFASARYFPDIFAGGVALSGGWTPEDGINMTHMPLLALHGKQDSVLPAEPVAALMDIIKSRGGTAYYQEIPDMGHSCPSSRLYTDKVWSWLFNQKKS